LNEKEHAENQTQNDPKVKKRKEKAMPGEYAEPDLKAKSLSAPIELDFFALETKARNVIAELMEPILDDMNCDRQLLIGLKL